MSTRYIFNEEVNCSTCKNGYHDGYSWDGWHNLCGAGRCYLCAERDQSCSSYEKGEPPEGEKPLK